MSPSLLLYRAAEERFPLPPARGAILNAIRNPALEPLDVLIGEWCSMTGLRLCLGLCP